MATYKSEFFDHYYRGRLRPLAHFSLGWLPRWLKLTGRLSRLVNAVLATPLGKVVAAAGGLTTKRALPRFAGAGEWRREIADAVTGEASVVLFVDTFTRGFRPEVAGAAARVLADAGDSVVCSADACCGLTWISTGQLGTAKRLLSKAAEALDDGTDRPIVVIEPSCAAALRKDLPELVPTEQARRVASRVRSFAAYVADRVAAGWEPSSARPVPERAVLQTHCHEYSVFGAAAQRTALKAAGVRIVVDADGCCGVAGNFGFEAQHYDVSMRVAENALAPALRATGHDVAVLTDGFSCARQVDQLDPSRPGLHLAQVLDPRATTTSTDRPSKGRELS
ncbi:(Fe-S)-binding protein [Streptomyces sp. NPDC001536]|uniref:(Fe-S)-binding protein n=1 Tax=Streptomyces sp. NPDC001536 TaxID=3364583 RepID=UPI00368BC57D